MPDPTHPAPARVHLRLDAGRFSRRVEEFSCSQPGGMPYFLSHWPDEICHEALACLVQDIGQMPAGQRLGEACFQLVQHLSPMALGKPWLVRAGAATLGLSAGAADPIRRRDLSSGFPGLPPGCHDHRPLPAPPARLVGLVREADVQTRARGLPLAAPFLAVALGWTIGQEMRANGLKELRVTYDEAIFPDGRRLAVGVDAWRQGEAA